MILAGVLALSSVQFSTVASTVEQDDYVYLSVSDDDKFVLSDGECPGEYMAFLPISLSEVKENVDLSDYGLSKYNYDADGDGKNELTLLYVFIYAMEHYYKDKTDKLNITGQPGSMYMQYGFWGHDENLTYYVNGKFPLEREGWGATADRILVHPGDFVNVSMFSSWDFYNDPLAGYHFFMDVPEDDSSGRILHDLEVTAGESFTLKLVKTCADITGNCETSFADKANYDVYAGTKLYDEEALSYQTDESGLVTLCFEEPGEYQLWVDGEYSERIDAICSAPGHVRIHVKPAPNPEDLRIAGEVTTLIRGIGTPAAGSIDSIHEAKAAYDALTDVQKALIASDDVSKLQEAVALLPDLDKAQTVRSKITGLGDISTFTLEMQTVVQNVRAAYDTLTSAQKRYVESAMLERLVSAEEKIAELLQIDHVRQLIENIGTVTLEKKADILEAETAYESLTAEQKAYIGTETVALLQAAKATLAELEETLSDQEKAAAVAAIINSLGEVTYADKDKVQAAKTAYDALTDAQKAYVEDNVTYLLTAALIRIADMEQAANVTMLINNLGEVTDADKDRALAAKTAYDALTDAQKAYVEESVTDLLTAALTKIADMEKAAAVTAIINSLGEVTYADKDKVLEAGAAYDALTNAQKAYVDNSVRNLLMAAQNRIADMEAAAEVCRIIRALGEVSLEKRTEVENARAAYAALTVSQLSFVDNETLHLLTDAEEKIKGLDRVQSVVAMIDQIGEVTLYSKSDIEKARNAYEALIEDWKAWLPEEKMKLLEEAEARYAELYQADRDRKRDILTAQEVEEQILALGEITLDSKEDIEAARAAYDALTDAQKALVDPDAVKMLIAAEKSYAEQKAADDEKKATIIVNKITITGLSHKIAAGKKLTLKATVSPDKATNKAVTWKSSNAKVATVTEKGVVTIKAKTGGKSVSIIATAKDGSGVKASFKITSMKAVVKKIALTGKTSVKAGKSLKLSAKVTASKGANKTLKWTSSNKKYATVSSKGVVKALKAGKGKYVTITAKAIDGSGKYAKKKIKIK